MTAEDPWSCRRNANTEEGSARNISYHYDAGNDFYKLFLDETMLYSSGIHEGGLQALQGLNFKQKEEALVKAQYAKVRSGGDARGG